MKKINLIICIIFMLLMNIGCESSDNDIETLNVYYNIYATNVVYGKEQKTTAIEGEELSDIYGNVTVEII